MIFLDKLIEVNSILVALTGGGILVLLTRLVRVIKNKNEQRSQAIKAKDEQINTRLNSLEKANLAMLHNKVYTQCQTHLDNEFISLEDLDDLDYLFSAYKHLGGNGTGETIYNKVKELPNKR